MTASAMERLEAMDNDVIPMTIAFLRERLGDEAEPAVALILARDEAGTIKYGQPLRTFDGRKTLWDRAEELADDLNYTLKFLHEWDEVAGLLELAAARIDPHFGHTPDDVNGHPHPAICSECTSNLGEDGQDWTDDQVEYWRSSDPTVIRIRETAARMRKDVARIQPKPVEPAYGHPGQSGRNYQCHGCGEFTATYTNGHRDICDKCWVTTAGALHYTKFVADEAKQ